MTRARETGQILRFGAVGGVATATHLAIVALLAGWTALAPALVHAGGYAGAFLVSFFGHYHVTFRSRRAYAVALRKFMVVSLAVFLASVGIVWAAVAAGLAEAAALLLAAMSVPVLSYVLNRAYVY
ncbi:GtrA family protein [Salipiger mucosus]|uniref:GtrA/DPMS transmembrane domain-containing protein n=1 Tax=Salipiger mucosus DSM 16094 TaxID=1123237 RepID=S9RRI5_9RHOB|nr:GtrA family protein [Salipiger mucosus]EPX76569.1 hypothetical protein Salmuc_00401 [Salipiger mucosus DSM 16094]